jgi:hypothetical protein
MAKKKKKKKMLEAFGSLNKFFIYSKKDVRERERGKPLGDK